jgi:uncharacterized protein
MSKEKFLSEITAGYTHKGPSIILGAPIFEGEVLTEQFIRIPLKTMNRHGLIAGATGTGKTKTLQVIAEQLSANGVPTLLMDIKGDLSGIAAMGKSNPNIEERHMKIGLPFLPDGSPVELMSLSNDKGLRLRATVTEFGPVLFSKILELNDTQAGVISLVFKWCDDNQLPLIDLEDIKKVLQFISAEGKEAIEKEYGVVSTATVGTIMRKIVELEQQGADKFFGEPSFDVDDLCRVNEDGKGVISILRVTDIQDKPKLFSTFMLQILAEIYATFPEAGDMEKPKLCLFIDEAHLVFSQASDALLNQIETIIKLIRSKGVGIYFITQVPSDVPDNVLSQLGLKAQHALRAFTAKDRKAIKLAAENFPISEHYNTDELLTALGIGETLFTALNEKGIPTPLVHCYLRAPQSRMDVLTDDELNHLIKQSELNHKYSQAIDRESAYEILGGKIEAAQEEDAQAELRKQREEYEKQEEKRRPEKEEKSMLENVLTSSTARSIGSTVAKEITRGLLGVLGIKTSTRRTTTRKKSFSWF